VNWKIFIYGVLIYLFKGGVYVFGQNIELKHVVLHVTGVYNTDITLAPVNGNKQLSLAGIKNNKKAILEVPAFFLPGEFTLRFNYRIKETDTPIQSERILFINNQNVELWVNPAYINNTDSIRFTVDEKENTTYEKFARENDKKRVPVSLIENLLLNYDRPTSIYYGQCIKEFNGRRDEYNKWLKEQSNTYKSLYVSRLFQFYFIPYLDWNMSGENRFNLMLKNYFEGIDFNDTLLIHTLEFSKYINDYMGLYAMYATTTELRDSLFVLAGQNACELASKGHPIVYGWIVDYFFNGYESYNIDKGIEMLKKHTNNPNCLTSKKKEINKRLEGMKKLSVGTKAPDFTIGEFNFYNYNVKSDYKLLLFWSADCVHCDTLITKLNKWYNEPDNNSKIDVITVSVDDNEYEIQKWENKILQLKEWKHLRTKGGINSDVSEAYYLLSTPVMFLIDSRNNIIVSTPDAFELLVNQIENEHKHKEKD